MVRTDIVLGVSFYNRNPEFFQRNSHNSRVSYGNANYICFPLKLYFSPIQEVLFHELIFGRVICWEGGFVGLKIFRVPWKPHPFLLPNKKGSEETQPNGTWICHVICWCSTSLPASTPYPEGYLLPCLSAWVCPWSTLCLPGSLRQGTQFTT